MMEDQLPDDSRIVRYASPTKAEIPGSAFVRAEKDKDGLSVNWLCFQGTPEEQVAEVRRRSRLTLKANGRFFRVQIDQVRRHLQRNASDVGFVVICDPQNAEGERVEDTSHSLVTDLPAWDDAAAELIGDLIAQCIIEPHFPGRIV
jgi:hypothetical protein